MGTQLPQKRGTTSPVDKTYVFIAKPNNFTKESLKTSVVSPNDQCTIKIEI